jgi:hypothetical protein
MAHGTSMPSGVECVPGPNGTTAQAEFIFDVAKAVQAGAYSVFSYGGNYFDFYAYGENTPGFTSANSGILLFEKNASAYNPNPACP